MTNPTPEAIEALVNALRTKSAMINMGEKIAWGSETSLMDQAADMLTALAQRQRITPPVRGQEKEPTP